MKILLTGTQGLAQQIAAVYDSNHCVCVSRSTGHDIHLVDTWGDSFLDFDMVFNCAYGNGGQLAVLEYFFNNWQLRKEKSIITIGSKVITQPRVELELDHEYWPYRHHKCSLQIMHDRMLSTAQCNMKIINPGVLDTDMARNLSAKKMSPLYLAKKIQSIVDDPTIKRIDLWL
jgi:hypothetical protein